MLRKGVRKGKLRGGGGVESRGSRGNGERGK